VHACSGKRQSAIGKARSALFGKLWRNANISRRLRQVFQEYEAAN
jgi:hypothetical protein